MRILLLTITILFSCCLTKKKFYALASDGNITVLNQNDSSFVRIKSKYKGYKLSKLNAVYLTHQKIFLNDSLLFKKFVTSIMSKHYNKFLNDESAKLRLIVGDNQGLANGYIAYKMGEYPNYFICKFGTNIVIYATRNSSRRDGSGWDKYDSSL